VILGRLGGVLGREKTPTPAPTEFRMPEYKPPDMSSFTAGELANIRSQSKTMDSPASVPLPEVAAKTAKEVAAARQTLSSTLSIDKANQVLDEFPELESQFSYFRLKPGDPVILPDGRQATVTRADKMIIQVDAGGKTVSVGRKAVKMPEVVGNKVMAEDIGLKPEKAEKLNKIVNDAGFKNVEEAQKTLRAVQRIGDKGQVFYRGEMVPEGAQGKSRNIQQMQTIEDVLGWTPEEKIKRFENNISMQKKRKKNAEAILQNKPDYSNYEDMVNRDSAKWEIEQADYFILSYQKDIDKLKKQIKDTAEVDKISKENDLLYVTTQKETANSYAKQIENLPDTISGGKPEGYNPTVYEMKGLFDNTLDLTHIKKGEIDMDRAYDLMDELGVPREKQDSIAENLGIDEMDGIDGSVFKLFRGKNLPIVLDAIKDKGYDSIRYSEGVQDNWIVLDRSKISLVEKIDAIGKFDDKTKSDILNWKPDSENTSKTMSEDIGLKPEKAEMVVGEDVGLGPEKADGQAEIPLSPGISPMSVRLPDTIETITSKSEGNSLFNKIAPENIKSMAKKLYYKTVDGYNRINDFDKTVAKAGGTIPYNKRAYILAHNTSNAEALAQRTLTENLVDSQGNVVGAPLKDIVQQVPKGQWRQFEDYLKLKHSKAWENSDMTVYDRELNMSPEMADMKIVKYDAENPWMAQAAKDYTSWINKFGETWLVETGLIPENVWNAMRVKYGDYVPMQRLMEEVEIGKTGAKGSFADQPNPVKRARGSERKTIESLETMIERVPNYIKAAKRNEVMQRIIEDIQKDPEGMSIWGEIVDSNTANLTMPNIVAGRINGERVHVRVNDLPLLEAISGLTPQAQNVVMDAARSITSKMKLLTTGINPIFSLGRNVVRDLPMSYVASKSTNSPVEWSKDIVGALLDILGNRAAYKSYKDMGGGYASAVSTDVNILANSKAKLMPGYYDFSNIKNPVEYTKRLLGVPFKALEKLADFTEAVPRLSEYRRIIRKDGDSYASRTKALYESKDVTVNFQKKNTADVTNFLDAFIPYFGASINGIDKLARIYKDNPVAALGKTFAAITVPTLMLYAYNHDNPEYQKLSSWTKDTNYLIPLPGGTFLKLPKPREGGVVFGALVERTLDSLKKENPDAFAKFSDTIWASFMPPGRTIAAPINDLRANKDFVDRPVVPEYMKNMSPGQQYDEKTSSFAKKLGESYPEKVSPKQVDYLVKSYLGVIGQVGIPALSEGSTGDTLKRIFTADPAYNTDVTQKFYDAKRKLDTMKADTKQTGEVIGEDDEKLRKLYGKVAEMISDNRTALRELQKDKSILPKQKTIKLRDMQVKAVALADIVNQPLDAQLKIYEQLKRRRFITEDKPKSPARTRMDERNKQKRNSAIESILSE